MLHFADPRGDAARAVPQGGGPAFGMGALAIGGSVLAPRLDQSTGELFPRWLPRLGGRHVPPAPAIAPALIVSASVLAGGLATARLWLTGAVTVERESWIASAPMAESAAGARGRRALCIGGGSLVRAPRSRGRPSSREPHGAPS